MEGRGRRKDVTGWGMRPTGDGTGWGRDRPQLTRDPRAFRPSRSPTTRSHYARNAPKTRQSASRREAK